MSYWKGTAKITTAQGTTEERAEFGWHADLMKYRARLDKNDLVISYEMRADPLPYGANYYA
jgi:hypothetical protein